MAKSKSRSKRKSKRTSKPRTSHKGLIAGLSIGGVVALIAGALVVMFFMGVFDDLFKKKSKPPRVNDKRGPLSTLDILKKKRGSFNVEKNLTTYIILNSEDGPKIQGRSNVKSDSNLKKDELYKINYDNNTEEKFTIIFKENTIITQEYPSNLGDCSDENRENRKNEGFKDCNCIVETDGNNVLRCSAFEPEIEYIYNKDINMIGVFLKQFNTESPFIIIDASLFE
tara:strand:- start:672 stop:1349 length:678 start_codon:yes stop_codon:yes gene_type:complete